MKAFLNFFGIIFTMLADVVSAMTSSTKFFSSNTLETNSADTLTEKYRLLAPKPLEQASDHSILCPDVDRSGMWLADKRKVEMLMNYIIGRFEAFKIRNHSKHQNCEEVIREYWLANQRQICYGFLSEHRLELSPELRQVAFEEALKRYCPKQPS